MRRRSFAVLRVGTPCVATLGVLLVFGCGTQPDPIVSANPHAQGVVRGGQQAISNATIQLYAVNTTADGGPATALLSPPIASDANGNFNITGLYTCPTPTSLVYITATGGNPGLTSGTDNTDITLMAALGQCQNLSSSTFITINEVTTVAAAYALVDFTTSATNIGAASAHATALANAFALASQYVNVATGTSPGTGLPTGYTAPVAMLNTLADILSACVNSTGGTGACSNLFGAVSADPSLPTPTNTFAAVLNVAYLSIPPSGLFALLPSTPPFQPTITAAPATWAAPLVLPPNTLTLSPSSLSFASSLLGNPTSTQSLTLSNTSATTAVPVAVAIGGTNTADFFQTNNCPSVLTASTSCAIQVGFAPTAAGSRSAQVTVATTNAIPPTPVSLSGTGTAGTNPGPITVSAASLTFPGIGTQSITITNSGSATLNISDVYILGSPYFQQTNNCGSALPAQSICTIQVSVVGVAFASSATLTVSDDAVAGPQTISLQSLTTANLPGSVSGNINFGSLALTDVSPLVQFYGPEGGPGYVTGANPSDFPSGCEEIIHSTCEYGLNFSPASLGVLSANFGSVELEGFGLPHGPNFSLLSSGLTFGPSGTSLTFLNNGSTSLTLSPSLSGPNASTFTVGAGCSPSLSPAMQCSIAVGLPVTVPGTFSATLTLTDTSSGLVNSYSLTGIGAYPAPSGSPSTLAFGPVHLGATSAPMSLTITAPNSDPVRIVSNGPQIVSITQGGVCSLTPCMVSVTFTPQNAGPVSEPFIYITDLLTGEIGTVTASGTGGAPTVTLTGAPLSFSARNVGTTSIPQSVTLTNTGDAALTSLAFSLVGADPNDFIIESNTCGTTLNINAQCAIGVSFAPTASGPRSAAVQILSNASSSPDAIQLSGTAN